LTQNVEGDFYVDASCIDCDACRQIAPETFRDHGDQSSVGRQPEAPEEMQRALMALVACPTASIGTMSHRNARKAARSFPSNVFANVFFCGFTSEASFGAWSYLVLRRPEDGGNVLVDSPRFAGPLVKRLEQMGGVALMFLSHQDDIADHAKFAAHFHCPRVMHRGDGAERLGIEHVTEGEEPVALGSDLLCIPTPGHTRGHQVLLYREQALFTGDHLAWSPERLWRPVAYSVSQLSSLSSRASRASAPRPDRGRENRGTSWRSPRCCPSRGSDRGTAGRWPSSSHRAP
jgi:ferredoxin